MPASSSCSARGRPPAGPNCSTASPARSLMRRRRSGHRCAPASSATGSAASASSKAISASSGATCCRSPTATRRSTTCSSAARNPNARASCASAGTIGAGAPCSASSSRATAWADSDATPPSSIMSRAASPRMWHAGRCMPPSTSTRATIPICAGSFRHDPRPPRPDRDPARNAGGVRRHARQGERLQSFGHFRVHGQRGLRGGLPLRHRCRQQRRAPRLLEHDGSAPRAGGLRRAHTPMPRYRGARQGHGQGVLLRGLRRRGGRVMTRDIALVVVSLIVLVTVMIGVKWLGSRFSWRPELARKGVHVATGLYATFLPFMFGEVWPVLLLVGIAAAAMLVLRLPRLAKDGLGSTLHGVERHSYGELLLAAAIGVVFALSIGNPVLYVLPMAVLTLSDAAAALVGTRYGRKFFEVEAGNKRAEGGGAFFLVTWIVAMVVLLLLSDIGRGNVILLSLIIAAFGAMV